MRTVHPLRHAAVACRDCSMGLHDDDDDNQQQRHVTEGSSPLHHGRFFARLSLSGSQAEEACTAAPNTGQTQEQQPIASPFASQRAQHMTPGAGQQWTPLTPQLSKGLSMSRMDTLKEKKSLPFVFAC